MFLINYGTSQYFEKEVWDKHYCKSITSVKKQLEKLADLDLENNIISEEEYLKIMIEFRGWGFDKKTCFSCWDFQVSINDLHISVTEINLI